jgi:hypothetical protein
MNAVVYASFQIEYSGSSLGHCSISDHILCRNRKAEGPEAEALQSENMMSDQRSSHERTAQMSEAWHLETADVSIPTMPNGSDTSDILYQFAFQGLDQKCSAAFLVKALPVLEYLCEESVAQALVLEGKSSTSALNQADTP